MLVKINNSGKYFLEQIAALKTRFDVGTSSGAATHAVTRYMDLEERFNDLISKFEKLEGKHDDLRSLVRSKAVIDKKLSKML